jgi:hypothetical protein
MGCSAFSLFARTDGPIEQTLFQSARQPEAARPQTYRESGARVLREFSQVQRVSAVALAKGTGQGRGLRGLDKMRGSFKGAIRIPLRALMLFFNGLALLRIPRKSLKFHSSLFSIPTAPTPTTAAYP